MEPDFIKDCPADVQRIYRYWDSKRRGRAMPARADIEAGEIKDLLPGLMIVEVTVDERRYVYRLVGTREVAMRGRDPTGQSVVDKFFGQSQEHTLNNYDTVVRTKAPWRDATRVASADDRYIDDDAIFLPLSGDGETVNKILVYTHQIKQN